MKSTALLAVAIFLVCAPSPDSKTISEMSHGFLSHAEFEPLLASDSNSNKLQLLNSSAAKRISKNKSSDETLALNGEI